jgi:ketosteroid isomerase-like protein
MLSLATLLWLAPLGFAGTWSGTVTIHAPDNHVEHGTVVLWIGTRGDHWVGSLGETADRQKALSKVITDGESLYFQFSMQRTAVAVKLAAAAGHLSGSANGTVTIDFDLQRSPTVHTLYEKVSDLDDRLFSAYNGRDLNTIEGLFTKDLEFYHDKDGLTGYRQNMDAFRRLFKETTRYRRELDESSLEVYPVKGKGAMEIGIHRFYYQAPGKPEQLAATAKFVHIWMQQGETWKISRVVSYDHE